PIARFGAEGINHRLQHPNRTHVRILTTPTDKIARYVTPETTVAQVNWLSHMTSNCGLSDLG
ncbi:hypothetical protein, partial [Mycobacteroides salmoniphilum]|uniref:hypothetical protein n=1 Tax=Mycobacteroides salmoniphilum TaxID=404941 RepID=UPI001B80C314